MSTSTEPATVPRPFFISASTGTNRRSYRCYNCSHSFHVSPAGATNALSPSSFRCPRCYHRHLLPNHTISPPPPIAPLPPPPPPPMPPPMNSIQSPGSNVSPYYTSDDSDSDYDYDSDSSLLSFTSPNFYTSTPALRSFVNSLPMKILPPNSTPSLQSCSICLDDFEINPNTERPVNELPCEHYFHKDCISEWLQRNYTCPLCRFKLPIEPHQEEQSTQLVEDHDAVLPLDLAPRGERILSRVTGIQSFGASAAANSGRLILSLSAGIRNRSGHHVTEDEEGDTLMVDA
ncbi:hypothetical protein F511_08340 [Dorcoceras hygrometricum]|uniref:RING-type domain-containing protein n=1 Tax=Dorcoceras hygrometricum TaxID=472368 RepID=A0A2Z7DA29_9LAMI|nr:hypothetical protein F511_08340 [Dorcoceras hygrometricum]